jgi:hypothetical protein
MGNYGKYGDLVAVTSGGDTADRAVGIMTRMGAAAQPFEVS